MGRFAPWLLWTNIVIAGSAAGWAAVTLQTLRLPRDWPLISLAFCLALGFYTRDRLDERTHHADRLSMPARTAWMRRHRAWLKGLVWASFLASLTLVVARPPAALPLLAGLGFALSYTLRWLPWRGRRYGWKHLPGLKMPFVASLWALTAVLTPATVYAQLWTARTWLLAGAVCALVMVQILLNDLRDLAGDRASGTLSLPVWLGDSKARRIGYLLALLAALLMWPLRAGPFLLAAAYSSFRLWRYRRERDDRWRFWIEAQGLVVALFSEWWRF